jgi:hypothetical protein
MGNVMACKKRRVYPVKCCRCNSLRVVVELSRAKDLASGPGFRELERRQRLKCQECQHRWWRLIWINERY